MEKDPIVGYILLREIQEDSVCPERGIFEIVHQNSELPEAKENVHPSFLQQRHRKIESPFSKILTLMNSHCHELLLVKRLNSRKRLTLRQWRNHHIFLSGPLKLAHVPKLNGNFKFTFKSHRCNQR
jgi:hypothetical protein